MRSKYSEKYILKAIEYSKIHTTLETAIKFNVSIGSVKRWRDKAGLKNKVGSAIYTVPFKIKVVEEYLYSNMSQEYICKKYNIKLYTNKNTKIPYSPNLQRWIRDYKDGKLRLDNTISISHKREVNTPLEQHKDTSKEQTITINGKIWIEYSKPSEVININGTDYVLKG
jgi:transposase-like protein